MHYQPVRLGLCMANSISRDVLSRDNRADPPRAKNGWSSEASMDGGKQLLWDYQLKYNTVFLRRIIYINAKVPHELIV